MCTYGFTKFVCLIIRFCACAGRLQDGHLPLVLLHPLQGRVRLRDGHHTHLHHRAHAVQGFGVVVFPLIRFLFFKKKQIITEFEYVLAWLEVDHGLARLAVRRTYEKVEETFLCVSAYTNHPVT